MKKIVIILCILLIPITLAMKITTTDFEAYYLYSGGGLANYAYSDKNVSFSVGQYYIGNYTTDGHNPKVGLYYIENLTRADTVPPVITVYSPTNTTYTTNNITINWTATDAVTLSEAWYDNTTGNTSSYSGNVILSDGTYLFVFYANDSSGNINAVDVSFTVDTTVSVISGLYRPSCLETDGICTLNSDCCNGFVCIDGRCKEILEEITSPEFRTNYLKSIPFLNTINTTNLEALRNVLLFDQNNKIRYITIIIFILIIAIIVTTTIFVRKYHKNILLIIKKFKLKVE